MPTTNRPTDVSPADPSTPALSARRPGDRSSPQPGDDGDHSASHPESARRQTICPGSAFTGQSFVVAWREGEGEVRGAEVALDGTPIGTAGFVISPPGEVAERPALVSNGAAQTVALYDRFDDSPAFHVRRVRAKAIASGAPGARP